MSVPGAPLYAGDSKPENVMLTVPVAVTLLGEAPVARVRANEALAVANFDEE